MARGMSLVDDSGTGIWGGRGAGCLGLNGGISGMDIATFLLLGPAEVDLAVFASEVLPALTASRADVA